MKHKALIEPKPLKTFRDKYLAVVMLVAAFFITFIVSAQTDSAKYSGINGYGFRYKRHVVDSVQLIPLSTSPHVPYRMGGIRYNPGDSTLQLWTGHQWNSIVTGGNGIDTAYALNDSTITIETPNQTFFVVLKGQNISNASLTAQDDYQQDWANHWFFLNNLKALDINSSRADPNHPDNLKVFRFYSDSTASTTALQLAWGLKDVNNSSTDSVHMELVSQLTGTSLYHWGHGGGRFAEMDIRGNVFDPTIDFLVANETKASSMSLGSTTYINPNDSLRIKAVPAPSATKMLAIRDMIGNVGTVVALDLPTSSSDTFGLQDNKGVRDRYMNMQGHDFAIDSAGQMDLKGQSGGINSQLTISNVARLFSYDNIHEHSISVLPTYIGINGDASNSPPKIWVQASDSLKELSPSSVAVFKNDTIKSIPVADLAALLGAGVNFANTDLTFTADRFHDNNGHSLSIHGTGDNAFKTVNGTKQYTTATSSAAASLSASNSANNHFSEVNAIDSSVILNGGENGLFYNQLEVSKNNIRLTTRANTTPHIFKLDSTGQLSNDAYTTGGAFTVSDTTPYKALVVDANGKQYRMSGWPGGGGGSGEANTASNQGSGAGLFKTKSGVDLQFKSLTSPYGISYTSNTNDVSAIPDTASGNGLSTKYYTNNPTRWPGEEPIGSIYSRNNWANSMTDFLANPAGGASLALNSGYVDYTVSSISWGNYTTILPLRATILPAWSISVTFKQITAPASGTVGFGLGTHKAIGGNGDVLCYINTTNGGGSGTLAINRGDGAATWQTGSSFTVNQNDIIKLTVTFVDSSITFSANNLTTGGSGSINYTNTLVSAASPISLISNWALIGHSSTSCTWQIQDINISSQTKRNSNLVAMGDSKTQGAFASYFASRFGTRLNSSYPSSVVYASGNAKIDDFLTLCQDEIGALNGRQYLLSLGSNDKRGVATLAHMEDSYSKLVKLLEGGGAKVLHIVLPEDSTSAGVGLTDFKQWVATTYASNYIDVWTTLSTSNKLKAGYNSGDGVHPNEAANKSIDSLVVLSGKITTNPINRRQAYRVSGGLVELFGDSITTRPFDKALNRVNHWDATGASRTGMLQDDGTIAGVSSAPLTPINGTQFNVTGYLGINGSASGLVLGNRNGALTDGRYTIYAENDRLNMYDLTAASTRWSLFSNGNILVGSTTDNGAKLQINGQATVTDDAYDATTWNGNNEAPTKNAVRDKIESLSSGGITSINSQTGSTQTIATGNGLSVNSSSNTHTISLATTLDAQYTDANNTGTSATDLYSKTIAANQLTTDGSSISFEAAGTFNDATASCSLSILFGGNSAGFIGSITAAGSWSIKCLIIRASSSSARIYSTIQTNVTTSITTSNLTGLDFTSTNILKITGTAGGAGGGSNDITSTMWKVIYQP